MPSADIIPFPGPKTEDFRALNIDSSFHQLAHQADAALVEAFYAYAENLACHVAFAPLHPADRAKLLQMVEVIQHG